jgi:hypothetical protein
MARRDESILNLLVECPWWVSVLVSGTAFVFFRFIFPLMESHNMAVGTNLGTQVKMQLDERRFGVKATLYALQSVVAEFGGKGER